MLTILNSAILQIRASRSTLGSEGWKTGSFVLSDVANVRDETVLYDILWDFESKTKLHI